MSKLARSKAATITTLALLLLLRPICLVMAYSLDESWGVDAPAISDIQDEVAAQRILAGRQEWLAIEPPATHQWRIALAAIVQKPPVIELEFPARQNTRFSRLDRPATQPTLSRAPPYRSSNA